MGGVGGGVGGWVGPGGGGGGALRYQIAIHCQTAALSRSGERQNIGVVNLFEGKKVGRSTCYLAPNKGSYL